jgi:hypothetical protein
MDIVSASYQLLKMNGVYLVYFVFGEEIIDLFYFL